jgi:branched-chain amino acid transport system substrate-binding protein
MAQRLWSRRKLGETAIAAATLAPFAPLGPARAADPIRIGISISLTGSLAANAKAGLMAMQMCVDDINAKGGLLGRAVQLIHYDDQSSPSNVPAIYTKLIDVDKVDLLISPYGTNLSVPAMPVAMASGRVIMGFVALAISGQFKYERYFQIGPFGSNSQSDWSKGFFGLAMSMEPKPESIAIVAADAEYPKFASEGAREHAKRLGLKIVYDRSYPPSTTDFTLVVRSIQATNPDIVYVASYPADSTGLLRSVNELGLKTRLFGGGLAGPQYASLKQQLGQGLNGLVDYDFYVPEPTMNFPGIKEFLERYQARAAEEGVDPLGFYLPPLGYALVQVLAQGVEGAKTIDSKALAEYLHKATFHTVVGDIRFGPLGERDKAAILTVQYQGIKGNDIAQFKEPGRQVILDPPELRSGTFRYPYSDIPR